MRSANVNNSWSRCFVCTNVFSVHWQLGASYISAASAVQSEQDHKSTGHLRSSKEEYIWKLSLPHPLSKRCANANNSWSRCVVCTDEFSVHWRRGASTISADSAVQSEQEHGHLWSSKQEYIWKLSPSQLRALCQCQQRLIQMLYLHYCIFFLALSMRYIRGAAWISKRKYSLETHTLSPNLKVTCCGLCEKRSGLSVLK